MIFFAILTVKNAPRFFVQTTTASKIRDPFDNREKNFQFLLPTILFSRTRALWRFYHFNQHPADDLDRLKRHVPYVSFLLRFDQRFQINLMQRFRIVRKGGNERRKVEKKRRPGRLKKPKWRRWAGHELLALARQQTVQPIFIYLNYLSGLLMRLWRSLCVNLYCHYRQRS